MPGTKEIRTKIASVKSTQKITKAMQMVATSKMRRAQERMKQERPYAQKMREVIGHLTQANPDYRHPFLSERDPKAVGIIVISTDRGLAGGLNANVFKQVLTLLREWQGKGAQVSLAIVGTKALTFFRRLSLPILANVSGLGDRPHVKDLIGTVKVMLDAYRAGELDRLFVGCGNKTMVMMDSGDGKVIGTVPIGDGVDATAFDPGTQLAFASCGDGTTTIAHEDAPDKLTVVQTLKTEPRARTMAVDPARMRRRGRRCPLSG